MRIDILAIGSRGDVQPYIALGVGLRRAGYRVRIVTLGGFENLVQGHGLDHLSIGSSPQNIAGSDAGREWAKKRSSTGGFVRGLVQVASSLVEESIANYWRSCDDVEALLVNGLALLVGLHIAERLHIPLIRTQTTPFARTRYDWAGRKNLVTALQGDWTAFQAALFRVLIWTMLRRNTNAARHNVLSLPPLPLMEPFSAMDRNRVLQLDGYSPAVVPPPPDWGDWIHVTGYWLLDEASEWTPPAELVDFLGSGPPPVFVGFGSTPFPRPEASTRMVVRALQNAGQRGILLAGGSGLETGQLTSDVISFDSLPHDWLFSRVCSAVHHGGAGVTGAALRAGLPSVVVPVFADQPFWGSRVFSLGAGPRPIPAKHLTEEALTDALRATAGKDIRNRAASLGELIRKEDGVARAVESTQQYLARSGKETKGYATPHALRSTIHTQ